MFCIIDREKNMTPIKSGFHNGGYYDQRVSKYDVLRQ